MFLIIFNLFLLVACITLAVFISRLEENKTGLIAIGYVVGIGTIIFSVIEQLITIFVGGLLMSLSDGNGFNSSAGAYILAILLIPVIDIVSAIVLLIKASKTKKNFMAR